MAVDTTRVAERRQLHFDKLEDLLADIDHLAQGRVKALGNWSPGQILLHLAKTMNFSIDGFPFRMPLPIRLLCRWVLKRRFLTKPMPTGIQLRSKSAEHLDPPPVSWEEGLQAFRQAVHRLLTESKREPSPAFGPMTRDEWNQLHCRHAELHLSFLVPD